MATTTGWDRESSSSISDRPRCPLVLIVDGDPAVRQMLGLAITRLGALPIGAANGLQAFTIAQRRTPDAIVTDLAVPGLDGAWLIRRLRDTPWGRDVPVVVFSGQLREPSAADVLDLPGVRVASRADGPGPVIAHLASVLRMRNARWWTER